MMLCSSLTYNAKEIRMLLKEEEDETSKWTVEWIIIDPAGWTGECPVSHVHHPDDVHTHEHQVFNCSSLGTGLL